MKIREKQGDLTQSNNKSLYTTEKSQKQRDNTKNATKQGDCTIADRFRIVSWSNNSQNNWRGQTGFKGVNLLTHRNGV